MADSSWSQNLLDEDIPIIDRAGKTRQLKELAAIPKKPAVAPKPVPAAVEPSVVAAPPAAAPKPVEPKSTATPPFAKGGAKKVAPPPELAVVMEKPGPAATMPPPKAPSLSSKKPTSAPPSAQPPAVPSKPTAPPTKEEAAFKALIQEVEKQVTGVFPDENSRHRFTMAANLYFKDLRDAIETKAKLTMPVVSAGLGLSEEQATKVMEVLEAKVSDWRAGVLDRVQDEKKAFVEQQKQKQDQRLADEAAAEQASLNAVYTRLTGKPAASPSTSAAAVAEPVPEKPAPPPVAKLTPPRPVAPPRVIPVLDMKKEAAAGPREDKKEKPAPGAAVSEAVSAVTTVPSHLLMEEGETPEKPAAPAVPEKKPLVAPVASPLARGGVKPLPSAPTPARPIGPPASPLPPRVKPLKPKTDAKPMDAVAAPASTPPFARGGVKPVAAQTAETTADAKYAPKLTGPVGELRSLTLKDFRRLSRDPHEATLKIRDKIDLLEEQSFETKSAGIKAWQESAVNKMYLDLLRRSLEGKPILDVIAELEAKGELTLDKAEFDAIMELNRKLRFG